MLVLHVSCNDDNTMNVTSNHLEVIPFPEDQEQQADPGEELSKRGEYFGHPVGKSEFRRPIYLFLTISQLPLHR